MTLRRAKIYIIVDVDEEEYATSTDDAIAEDIKDAFESHIYDTDGITVNKIKILMGD